MPIRAVLYDLDGTLRKGHPAGRDVFADFAAQQGIPVTAEIRKRSALWEHYYWAESPEQLADRQNFSDDSSFWVNYSWRQLLQLGASAEQASQLAPQLNAHMNENYRPVDLLLEGLVDTLACLRDRGIVLGVVSNRRQPFGEYLQEMGIKEYFQFSLAAGEVNSWKPDKQIFLHALRLAGSGAEETIYVGDNYYADVLGARNAGLTPVLIDPDGLFESPGCPVIKSHSQIISLL